MVMKPRPLPELAQFRQKMKWSRKDLAAELDIREVTVWRWETGQRRPARKYVPQVSEMTGIPAAELMGIEAA